MTTQEQKVLEKALSRAINRGWGKRGYDDVSVVTGGEAGHDIQGFQMSYNGEEELAQYLSVSDLIYAHDFARSLWGEKIVCSNCGKPFPAGSVTCTDDSCILKDHDMGELPYWAFNLQKMVLWKDPVEYLGKHI